MLTSNAFLVFHDCGNPRLLALLLQSNITLFDVCRRFASAEPNYGPLMFRCKEFFTSPSTEVGTRARPHVDSLSRDLHVCHRNCSECGSLL